MKTSTMSSVASVGAASSRTRQSQVVRSAPFRAPETSITTPMTAAARPTARARVDLVDRVAAAMGTPSDIAERRAVPTRRDLRVYGRQSAVVGESTVYLTDPTPRIRVGLVESSLLAPGKPLGLLE